MATVTAADKIGPGPLELYARAMANLIRIDLPGDTDTVDREPRLLGSYFHGNVEVLDADQIDDLSQRASTPPYAAVILSAVGTERHDGGNTFPFSIELRLIMRLPSDRETDATGLPQGRVLGALFERIYGDRYGLGATRLPHPDDMEETPPAAGRRCIADGIVEGLAVLGADATVGEDRLRTDYRINYRARFALDGDGRFQVLGGGSPP